MIECHFNGMQANWDYTLIFCRFSEPRIRGVREYLIAGLQPNDALLTRCAMINNLNFLFDSHQELYSLHFLPNYHDGSFVKITVIST
jgi:hypothetical protein